MSSLAGSCYLDAAFYCFYMVYLVVIVAQVCLGNTLEGCRCAGADCVADSAADNVGDDLAIDCQFNHHAELTLFTDANREACVRCKGKGWLLLCCQIVWQVGHAGFLAASEYHAVGVVWLDTQLLHTFERIQTNHCRTLIVRNAASVDVTVLFNHIVWVMAPTVALRYNVQMCQQSNLFFCIAVYSGTCIVIIVFGSKAHAFANLQSFVEHLAAAFAVWSLWIVICYTDALDVDQGGNILQKILSIICNKLVDSGFHFFRNHL